MSDSDMLFIQMEWLKLQVWKTVGSSGPASTEKSEKWGFFGSISIYQKVRKVFSSDLAPVRPD